MSLCKNNRFNIIKTFMIIVNI